MRLPTRRSEKLKIHDDDGPLYLTPTGLQKLKSRLAALEKRQLPEAIEEVKRTAEFGDFSENAEYQQAKYRLRRIHAQIFTIKEELKRVEVIAEGKNDRVQLGTAVVLEIGKERKTFHLVGPRETDPTRNRISHLSPLGKALMGKTVGETVMLKTAAGDISYHIVEIK